MSIPGLLPLALSLFMWLVDTTSAYQLISETTNTTSTSTSTGNTDKIDRAHTYTYADIVFEQNDVKKLENGKHPLCARGFSADELSFLGSSDETVAFKTSLLPDFGKQYVIKIKRENAWGKFRAHKQYKNWKSV